MFTFLSQNGYIEHRIQKGFLPKLSGTFEHTAQMANIIIKLELNKDLLSLPYSISKMPLVKFIIL